MCRLSCWQSWLRMRRTGRIGRPRRRRRRSARQRVGRGSRCCAAAGQFAMQSHVSVQDSGALPARLSGHLHQCGQRLNPAAHPGQVMPQRAAATKRRAKALQIRRRAPQRAVPGHPQGPRSAQISCRPSGQPPRPPQSQHPCRLTAAGRPFQPVARAAAAALEGPIANLLQWPNRSATRPAAHRRNRYPAASRLAHVSARGSRSLPRRRQQAPPTAGSRLCERFLSPRHTTHMRLPKSGQLLLSERNTKRRDMLWCHPLPPAATQVHRQRLSQ